MSSLDKPFQIYCDPTRQLYEKLGMVVNLKQPEKKPDYITVGFTKMTLSSLWNGVSSGAKSWKGGMVSQNGGEWLFEDEELRWCHRMKNTADHAEVGELKKVLGIS